MPVVDVEEEVVVVGRRKKFGRSQLASRATLEGLPQPYPKHQAALGTHTKEGCGGQRSGYVVTYLTLPADLPSFGVLWLLEDRAR